MPGTWIPFYADDNDFKIIFEWLNQQDDIAFFVNDGIHKWKATAELDSTCVRSDCDLWHIPGGPLYDSTIKPSLLIAEPFSGWTEAQPDFNEPREQPNLGSAPINIIRLKQRTYFHDLAGIGLSSFGWIGDYYKSIGRPAPASTKAWWRSLRKFISKTSIGKVTRSGPLTEGDLEIFCFPGAYEKFQNGIPRERNPR